MTPIQILHDIVIIARAIHAQVVLAQRNKKKLHTLAHTMQLVVTSLEGLSELPNNQQFIKSLTDFHTCIRSTHALVKKITDMGKLSRVFYAQTNEGEINHHKQQMIEFIPLLSLGLNAQLLMDRERDRQDDAADRQAFVEQKEQALRAAQAAAKIDQRERDAIILKQLASVRNRLEKQSLPPASPVSPILPEEFIVNLDDIIFEAKLEEGDFGSIYQGTWQDQPVTIKCFDHMATKQEHTQLTREAQVMSRLHHETIIHFYGACLDSERPCLLTSIMEKGDLQTALSSLSLTERFAMAKDLARGLAYLHGQNIIHGDIHPKHVGINQHNEAKWMDFGLAKVRTAGIASLPRVSHEAGWQAPESWQNRAALTPASDVYSFGMLLWTLVTGTLPYVNHSPASIMRLVERGERETIPNDVPRDCRELIEACWSTNVTLRPTAKQIAQRIGSMNLPVRAPSPTGEEYYQRGVKSEHAGNMNEAYEDYHRASEKQYPKSFTSLGLFALQGLGGQTVDKKKAENYLKSAAEKGHTRAMFNLGRIHEKGDTSTSIANAETALFWYTKAYQADPGDVRSAEKVATLTTRVHGSNLSAPPPFGKK